MGKYHVYAVQIAPGEFRHVYTDNDADALDIALKNHGVDARILNKHKPKDFLEKKDVCIKMDQMKLRSKE